MFDFQTDWLHGEMMFFYWLTSCANNKANLRDLIAATDLVILLKLDSNRRFFSPCDLDILMDDPET